MCGISEADVEVALMQHSVSHCLAVLLLRAKSSSQQVGRTEAKNKVENEMTRKAKGKTQGKMQGKM